MSNEAWQLALKELRDQYLLESLSRLAELSELVGRVEKRGAQAEQDTLRELRRHFHALAGSGLTYGFPGVSTRAREAELAAVEWMEGRIAEAGAQILAWRADIEALRRELGEPPSAPEAVTGGGTSSAPPQTFEVVMVESDPAVRATFARLAAQEGLIVRTAGSRADAVKALDDSMPDGVVTSVRLPDATGYSLVEHIRFLPGGEVLPVLMVSPMAAFLDKVEAIHCGADAYFDQPVDWPALMRRLQHLLERSRAHAARILVVEDDNAQAAYARTVLESAGYEVHVCNRPEDFEAELLAFKPDLVLMDIVLPTASGYDLVRFVRQEERHATLPVLFLTAQTEMEARIEGVRAGGDDHLVKPVTPSLLLCSVASRIERARFVKALLERDGLTRLLTHTAFLERARAALAQFSRRPERSCAWVMLDLDHFKLVNDTHGHPVGDRVLAAMGGLLRRRLRQSDTIGRYGGEEFAVLLEDLREAEAVRLVERLREEFATERHQAPGGVEFHSTFSAGVAMLEPDMDLERWRLSSDQALYAAKAAGRNKVVAASEVQS